MTRPEEENPLQNHFDLDVSFPLEDGDYHKTRELINAEQRQKDIACMSLIDEAAFDSDYGREISFEEMTPDKVMAGKIDKDYADVLRRYFKDGMASYRSVFFGIVDHLGAEKNIKIIDPKTGGLIVEDARLGQITPNNCAVIEYIDRLEYENNQKSRLGQPRDFNELPTALNPLYLTMPGLKNVNRAIQKYEKYYSQYYEKKAKYMAKYGKDTPEFLEAVNHVRKPADSILDIGRCSLSVKRLQNVRMWADYFSHCPGIYVDQDKVKDKFCKNDVSRAENFTENNFRNYVFYIELPSKMAIEIQLKITALDEVDKLTHPFYEQLRVLKRQIKAEKDQKKRLQMMMTINKLEYTIKAVNSMGIEKHNQNEVFDKVYRVEEANRIAGKPLNADGLDADALRIIEDNFLARPKMAFNRSNPIVDIPRDIKKQYVSYRRNQKDKSVPDTMKLLFSMYDQSPYLQKLFKDCPPHIRDTMNRYMPFIIKRYRAVINGTEMAGGFMDEKYYTIPAVEVNKPSAEEIAQLNDVDKRPLDLSDLSQEAANVRQELSKAAINISSDWEVVANMATELNGAENINYESRKNNKKSSQNFNQKGVVLNAYKKMALQR